MTVLIEAVNVKPLALGRSIVVELGIVTIVDGKVARVDCGETQSQRSLNMKETWRNTYYKPRHAHKRKPG